jgi:hypothetical protein
VPLEQLQEAVAQKFPRSVPVQGLFDLTLQAPRLRLLPDVNRIGALMAVDAAGAALRRSHAGTFDVEFALRYEPGDRPRSRWARSPCTSCARRTPPCLMAWACSPARSR